jgi:glycosyltransferase involved in cell wall biosynthesis
MAGVVPLSSLVDILYPLSNDLYVITGNEGDIVCKDRKGIRGYSMIHKAKTQVVARIFNYIYLQLRISYRLIKLARNVDVWIFFMGEGLLLPVLTLKLLRKNIILSLAASSPKMIEAKKDISLLDRITKFEELINYILSNKIIIPSENLIKEWNLNTYRKKISIVRRHFINSDRFKITNQLNKRENLVGYIGRLSEEKGAINFVKAISLLKDENIKFLVGGDGPLRDIIERYLDEGSSNDKVKRTGWIPHDELPDYLNKLKLLIVPSYTESGPLIALEAISCGTPVLATLVGSIPSIIRDGETGFILENNSPECIAKNIIRVLNYPDLNKITKNARELVEKEFTYEAAVERYKKVLEVL